MPFFNAAVAATGAELTPRLTTIINTFVVWIAFPMCAWEGESSMNFIPSAFCWGLATFNALMAHVMPMMMHGYNPGAIQSLIMGPLGLYALFKYSEKYGLFVVLLGLIYGGPIGHGLFLLMPLKLVKRGIINEWGFSLIFLIGVVLVPLGVSPFFRAKNRKS